jgi:hypothetical protein
LTRAVLILRNKADREKAAAWCRNAPDGTRLELKAARRSIEQNSLLWQRLTEVAHQLDWYGQKLTAEDWKDIFSAALRKARVVPGIDGGFVPLGMRTSDMSKAEMAELLTLMEAFAAERGVVFRDLQTEAA